VRVGHGLLRTGKLDESDSRRDRTVTPLSLPFSSSRDPNKGDDNELVLLDVADFLKAK
jgi:hypothetical protein